MGVSTTAGCILLLGVVLYGVKQYMNGGQCTSETRIDGKVVIITGANAGLGKETAAELARRGGTIYLACRSAERGTRAVEDILEDNPTVDASNLLVMQLDLGSVASIKAFVTEFKKREKKLDVLVNNAGLLTQPEGAKTEDGFQVTFGVNHLGHFLLTNLLMDEIVSAAPSRVVTVSSRSLGSSSIHFDDPMLTKTYSMWTAYAQSKLANIMFSSELGRRLKGTGVSTYSLNPGDISTDIGHQLPIIGHPVVYPVLKVLFWPFLKDVQSGAQTQICCAVAEELVNDTGKYYKDCTETEPSAADARDEEKWVRLWDLSMDLLNLEQKDIHEKLRH